MVGGAMNRKKGFTLVELLVVITIIVILMSLLVVLISVLIDKARYAKTATTIKMLDEACKAYQVDFSCYPPKDSKDSSCLHQHLGMPRRIQTVKSDTGPGIYSNKPPIVDFPRDILQENSKAPDPKSNPVPIVDAFDQVIGYNNPPVYNRRGVDIWSVGKNGKAEYDEKVNDYDDVTNWSKEY